MKRRLPNERMLVKKEIAIEEMDDGGLMDEEEGPIEKMPKVGEETPEGEDEDGEGGEGTNGEEDEERGQAEENGAENGKDGGNELDSTFPAMISTLFGSYSLHPTTAKKKRPSHRRGNDEEELYPPATLSQGKFDLRDTRNFNSLLVEEVSRHPALFDFTRDEYKSTEARNRHWGEVAAEMNQTVEFVRTRWKTLRDRFKKEVRRQHQCVEGPIWQHYEKMLYLLPFIRDKDDTVDVGTMATAGGASGFRPKNGGRRGDGTADSGANDRATALWYGGREQHQRPSNGTSQQPPPINSCTAAILDLAMSAVTKLSPPPTDEVPNTDGRQFASREGLQGQEAASSSSSDTVASGNSSSSASSSSAGGGGGTAIVTTSLLRPFPCASINPQRIHAAKGPKRTAGEGEGGGKADTKWQQDDRDEDELFCKIVYRKLGRIGDERLKEYAKARIIDLLVEVQYGGGVDGPGTYQ